MTLDAHELPAPARRAPAGSDVAARPGGWMLAETAPQECVWMAFPPRGSAITQTSADVETTRAAWCAVAHAIAAFEPVRMVVDPADVREARGMLAGEIEILAEPLDDAWMRDIGPTFVVDRAGDLAAVSWVFNGWGQQTWARWGRDARIADRVARHAGVPRIASSLVNEGGAIVVDGEGTVLLTETVQLDPWRNPEMTRAMVEAELARTIGAEHAIWLPRGLHRDAQPLGTRGHVDMIVAIPSPGRLLVHAQTDPGHPDHLVTRQIIEFLAADRDATGAAWEIVEIPAPAQLRDRDGWVDFNYINHLVVNDAVIACRFEDPVDDVARGLLAESYPGREIVTVDARPIFACGGGIHCITQQQPRPTPSRHGDPRSPLAIAPELILAAPPPTSPLRTEPSERPPLRVGAVQLAWHPDPARHRAALADGIRLAAEHGAQLICLQELTLSPYFAITPDAGGGRAERLVDGPTVTFARELAMETGTFIHASLFEAAPDPDSAPAPGYNTAICVAPDGELVARTRKLHIPRFAGYHEDAYFRPGDTGAPIHSLAGARVALPTCWDQWFPELARIYGLAGAEVVVYPTAIGSEPHAPGFDSEPIWQQVITANGITSATFMVAVNRVGTEGPITFYGSSFISDPYGRVLAQAPRDRPAVLVADLDLDQRGDWLSFGLLDTRRPDAYRLLTETPTGVAA